MLRRNASTRRLGETLRPEGQPRVRLASEECYEIVAAFGIPHTVLRIPEFDAAPYGMNLDKYIIYKYNRYQYIHYL